ncbi:MAG: FtsX-like permease family protein [Planctomycetia bacterium]
MALPLAWKNLTHRPLPLAASLAGIVFAVVLMFIQLGFLRGLLESTVRLIRELQVDLVVKRKTRDTLLTPDKFPRQRMVQAAAVDGVGGAYALHVKSGQPIRPVHGRDGGSDPTPGEERFLARPIRLVGFAPEDPIFKPSFLGPGADVLTAHDVMLFDRRSKPTFRRLWEPAAALTPDDYSSGALPEAEFWNWRVRIGGVVALGSDFANDATAITNEQNFLRWTTPPGLGPSDAIDFALIVAAPGVSVEELRDRLEATLPDDLEVQTRDEWIAKEMGFWRTRTPIGLVFSLGVAVGVVVGAVMCYQVLYSDVNDHLPEFATLVALGYGPGYLVKVVLQEAWYLSLLSFPVGMAAAWAGNAWLAAQTGLPLGFTVGQIAIVFALTVGMCMAAGLLAVRRALSADPAELFA